MPRVPGTAVFPHPGKETTPLALRANVEHNHVLHEDVIIVSASSANVPTSPREERSRRHLGYEDDRIQHLSVRFGFSDEPDLPGALEQACDAGRPRAQQGLDVEDASFFLSRGTAPAHRAPGWRRGGRSLFLALAHNAADPAAYFGLPVDRTVTMGSDVKI